ncbi:hypothetical protein LOC67_19375 [Stieleria sp. JC731]|uniref:hypothetical protein n=1 Tax=Pirellulaceae TaxID=2691357 RepID=UPI001E5C94C2|nr:hypothetical protein [Stieleria sp. JC731]MCC9602716.1 hypothetical protein [Stieleria sp. JC731]
MKNLFGLLVLSLVAFSAQSASAYTPEDPVVIQMVDRGVRFIEQSKPTIKGEHVVCAYAHYKVEHDDQNPFVAEGIRIAQEYARTIVGGQGQKSNYECAVAVLLLCEVSPTRYRNELTTFKRYFDEIQMSHGGYGYPNEHEGDVSQTQYAILAIWTLDRHGFKMDFNRLYKAMEWLLIVQDVNGPWPYHGIVPRNPGLASQKDTSMSMALAGAASLLIGGDAFRMWGDTAPEEEDTGYVGLPKAVKLYQEDANIERRQKTKKPSEAAIKNAIGRMEVWRKGHPETFGGNLYWFFYTAYTTERYESFVEIASGQPISKSPAWYNSLVTELMELQSKDSGGWETRAHTAPHVSTAFAVLFLIRSTQKSLGTGASATTIGGQGFSDNVSKAQLVNGKAVTKSPAQTVSGMLELLEGDGADSLDGKSLADSATLATTPVERSAQLDRLERLVRGSQSWQARRVSARLLGMSDELRVVPALIYALSDPDKPVRLYARDGLRFISRKFEGFDMPDEPSNSELRQAQRKWRDWFLTMKPDYVFVDDF